MTRRILVSYLTLTAIVLITLCVPLSLFFGDRERERFVAAVTNDAVVLAAGYTDPLENEEPIEIARAEEYTQRTGGRVVLVNRNGISLVDTGESTERDLSTRPEIQQALSGSRSQGTRYSETLDTEFLYVAVPIATSSDIIGAVRITVDIDSVNARVHRFQAGLAGVSVLVLLIAGVIGWILASSITRSLRDLQRNAVTFAAGNLEPQPIDQTAPKEVQDLAHQLNSMASQLDTLLSAQRRFVADASHQLRTPLTALKLRLENLEPNTTIDPQDLTPISDEVERLATLVEQLLYLSRSEGASAERTSRDFGDLVTKHLELWQAMADEHHIELSWEQPTPGHITVQTTDGSLEQILDNLLDNSIRAYDHGGNILVRLTADHGHATLAVIDHGSGLSDDDKARAFDRFWSSRSDGTGSGLGLAIVNALVRRDGGEVRLEDTPGTGLTVRVIYPLRRP